MSSLCRLLSPPLSAPDSLCSLRGGSVALGASTTYFFSTGLQYCFGVVFVAMLKDTSLGGSHLATSWVLSIEYFFFMFSGSLSAPLIASRGPRLAALAGAALLAAGFGLSSVVSDLGLLYVTYGLFVGVGCGLLNTAASYTVTQHFVKRRSLALGATLAGGGLGAIVLAPVVQAAISATGWRGALRLLAALAACVLPLAVLPFNSISVVPHGSATSGERAEDPLLEGEGPSSEPPPEAPSFSAALSIVPLRWFALGSFLYCGVFFTLLENLAPFLTDAAPRGVGLSAATAALLGSTQGAANVIGRLVIGAVGDLPGVSKTVLAQASMVAEAALLGCLTLAPQFPGYAYFFAGGFGFCAGSLVALQPAIVASLVPPQLFAHGLGLLYVCQSPAILLVPTLASAARDRWGSYSVVWQTLPLIVGAGASLLDGGRLAKWCRAAPCSKREDAMVSQEPEKL
jgi:MFS family permease